MLKLSSLRLFLLLSTTLLFSSPLKISTHKKSDSFCTKTAKNENFCMDTKLSYPFIQSRDKNLKQLINQAISNNAIPVNTQKYVLNYIKEMNGEVFSIGHSDDTTISLLSVTPKTFSLEISNSNYTGGAHGNYGTTFENYDKYTGEKLTLDRLFTRNYKNRLTRISERVYREKNKLSYNESLSETLGWFDNKFILPNAIGIGEDGLHLEYNPYEILPYAAGTTSLVVPYQALSSIIPENSYLSSFVKREIPQTYTINTSVITQENDAEITIQTQKMNHNQVKIKIIAENLSYYQNGGLSLSFPQLKKKSHIAQKNQSGFQTLKLYPKWSHIYHITKRKVVKSQYLLIEADTKRWQRGKTNTLTVIVNVPSHLTKLQLNVRATFKHKRDLIKVPRRGIRGQQGFYNYRVNIPL